MNTEAKWRKIQHKKMVNLLSFGSVLDLGFSKFPNEFLKNAIGIDYLKVKKPKNYSRIIIHDLNKNLPFHENSFDNVIASEVLEHLECSLCICKEINRILKPNGHFVFTFPNINYYIKFAKNWLYDLNTIHDKHGKHINELSVFSIYNILERSNFKLISTSGSIFEIPILARYFDFAKIVETNNAILSKTIIFYAQKTK